MAYLKGGTLIDGNIYVEGGLRVKQIIDSSGNKLPHLDNDGSSKVKRLVKFTDANAAISYSMIEESYNSSDGEETIDVTGEGTETISKVILGVNGISLVTIENNIITFDPSNVVFAKTPDTIFVKEKELKGLVQDASGTIRIGEYTYRESVSSEVPDIFYYGTVN